MKMKFTLDFSLETSIDRLNFIKSLNLSTLTKKELELCTDYILYGKDLDGLSSVDKKEVYIKPKYSSYSRPEPVSLDEMMESPTFDEAILSKERNIYKKVKPTIDKEKCKDIPGMKELWEQIEKIDKIIKIAEGKLQPDCGEEVKPLSSKDLYHLKHILIELRKDQYLLKDTAFPEIQLQKNYGSFYFNPTDFQLSYPVFPCGVMGKKNDINFTKPYLKKGFAAIDIEKEIERLQKEGKPYFSFLDKNHIYQLCLAYYEIKDFADRFPDSPLSGLLWTLDFYIEKANLSEQQKLIVEGKKRRLLNKEICQELLDKLGIYHQENYVSTIWNKVCGLIADAAELNYDEWCCSGYEKAWKKCGCCGEILLKDPRNFVRKQKSKDGFTNRCKKCDQRKRRGEI